MGTHTHTTPPTPHPVAVSVLECGCFQGQEKPNTHILFPSVLKADVSVLGIEVLMAFPPRSAGIQKIHHTHFSPRANGSTLPERCDTNFSLHSESDFTHHHPASLPLPYSWPAPYSTEHFQNTHIPISTSDHTETPTLLLAGNSGIWLNPPF